MEGGDKTPQNADVPIFAVGDRIIISNNPSNQGQLGHVRFAGKIDGSNGIWYGIELDTPTGKHNGSSKGKQYFECPPMHGIFLRGHHFEKVDAGSPQNVTPQHQQQQPPATISPDPVSPNKPSDKTEPVITQSAPTPKEVPKKPDTKAPTPTAAADSKKNPAPTTTTAASKSLTPVPVETVTKPGVKSTRSLAQPPGPSPAAKAGEAAPKKVEEPQVGAPPTPSPDVSPVAKPGVTLVPAEEASESAKELMAKVEKLEKEVADAQAQATSWKEKWRSDLELVRAKANEEKARAENEIKELKAKVSATPMFDPAEVTGLRLKVDELGSMVEKLSLQKEDLELTKETLELELAESQDRVRELEDQISAQQQTDMMKASDETGQLSAEELRELNSKLKIAVMRLNEKVTNDKLVFDEERKALMAKVGEIPVLEDKIQKLALLRDVLKQKDEDIEDLKMQIDEYAEMDKWIEKMTEQMTKKDEEMIGLRREIEALKEDKKLDQELLDGHEKLEESLQAEIDEKDIRIKDLEAKLQEHDRGVADYERTIVKFREKTTELQSQLDVLKGQMENSSEAENIKKIEQLLDKQMELNNMKAESMKREIEMHLQVVRANNEVRKWHTVYEALPEHFTKQLQLDGLRRYTMLQNLASKCMIVIGELRRRYLMKRKEFAVENIEFVKWMYTLTRYLIEVAHYAWSATHNIDSITDEAEYVDLMSNPTTFVPFIAINGAVDSITLHLKEETLSSKVPLDNFKLLLPKMKESPVIAGQSGAPTEGVMTGPPRQHRGTIELVRTTNIALIDYILLLNYAVSQGKEVSDVSERTLKKLTDFAHEFGVQVNRLQDLEAVSVNDGVATTLNGLLDVFEKCEELGTLNLFQLEPDLSSLSSFDVEGVSTRLDGDVAKISFGQALTVKEKPPRGSDTLAEDRVGGAGPLDGPWKVAIQKVHTELVQVTETVENYDRLNNQLRDVTRLLALREKETKEMVVVKESLEKRVADLQIKAERVNQLEGERKRLMDKEAHLNDAHEILNVKIDAANKKIEELENEITVLKSSPDNTNGGTNISGGGSMRPSTVNMSGVPVVLKEQMEVYDEAIRKLTSDNIALRNKEMSAKLIKMKEDTPNFAKLSQLLKRSGKDKKQQPPPSTISDSESGNLDQIMRNVVECQKAMKARLATQTVVDLEPLSVKSLEEKNKELTMSSHATGRAVSTYNTELLTLLRQVNKIVNKEGLERFESFQSEDVNKVLKQVAKPLPCGTLEVSKNQSTDVAVQNIKLTLTSPDYSRLIRQLT